MASSFRELLEESVDREVRLQRHGPDTAAGTLRHCGDDFIVLESVDGEVVLYPYDSVNAFSVATAPKPQEEAPAQMPPPFMIPVEGENEVDISMFSTLTDVMNALPPRIVKIGREGPGSVQGLILEVKDDYICMISDIKEIIYLPITSLKSFTLNPGAGKSSNNSQGKSSTSWTQWFK